MIKEDNFSYNSQLARRINGEIDQRPVKQKRKKKAQEFEMTSEISTLSSLAHLAAAVFGAIALCHLYLF
ncbi:MAG: hypothetical protein AB8G05_09580 [Oligoflexales bacterium]